LSDVQIKIIRTEKIQHPDYKVHYKISMKDTPYIVSEAIYHYGEYENIIFNPDDISKIRLLSPVDLQDLKQKIKDSVNIT
jgi:hypothetical protein